MDRKEIRKKLEDYDYTVIGGQYFIVSPKGDEDLDLDFPAEHTLTLTEGRVLVSACQIESEEDAAGILEYCGEYAGQ
jgi:hypothetical protein